jgi:hypothetical protein
VKKKLFGTRTRVVAVALTVAALVSAVAAYAYFTASGSGAGSAQTAKSAQLTVTQIGAGYDTLIPSGGYHQDQCFQCAQISKLGDDVTLANTGAQRLVSVTVAFRNWGPQITGLPITLTISNTTNGPVTATQDFNLDPVNAVTGRPTVTNVTFDLTAKSWFVSQEFVYGISFDPSFDAGSAAGLNVALSSSAVNDAIGTETNPGHIWMTDAGASAGNDFPSCTPGTNGAFASVKTNCGLSSPDEPGAYGNNVGPTSPDADVPAIEFNVVGGVVPGLTPDDTAYPIAFAITNPGSTPVHVNQVVTSISSLSNTGSLPLPIEACNASMYPLTNPTAAINATVAPGTTLFSSTGTTIQMHDDGNNQDNCQGATVNLAFAAS